MCHIGLPRVKTELERSRTPSQDQPAVELFIVRKTTIRGEQLRIVGDCRCNNEPILRIAMVLRQFNREPSDERRDGKQTDSRPIERGVKPRIQSNRDFDPPAIDEPCHLET